MPLTRSPSRESPNMADFEGAQQPLEGLPPFWRENPGVWFIQVEAMFDLARITSDNTKYRHVITQLDQSVLPFVADLLTSPPARRKYEAIKEKLIAAFESPESKLRRVLRSRNLGDEKPSHYLQKIRNLAGDQTSEAVLRQLFLEQLPENVRSILVISETRDLANLALQADKILEMHSCHVAAASRDPHLAPSSEDRRDDLREQVERLSKMVEALATRSRPSYRRNATWRRRSSSRDGRFRRRSLSREDRGGLCYFHHQFGERSFRCVQPCSWTGPTPGPNSSNNSGSRTAAPEN